MEMLKTKTKKFNGRSYKVSPLKEGPYKKGLVKNLIPLIVSSIYWTEYCGFSISLWFKKDLHISFVLKSACEGDLLKGRRSW